MLAAGAGAGVFRGKMKKLILIVALLLVPGVAHSKSLAVALECDCERKLQSMPKSDELIDLGFNGEWNKSYNNRVCGMKNYDNIENFIAELDYMGVTLAEAMTYARCGTKIGKGQQFVEYGPYFHHMVLYAGVPEVLASQITKELIVSGEKDVFINLMNGVGAENGRDLFSQIEATYEDPIRQDSVQGLKKLVRIFCKRISRHEITELYQLAQNHGCSDIPPVK